MLPVCNGDVERVVRLPLPQQPASQHQAAVFASDVEFLALITT